MSRVLARLMDFGQRHDLIGAPHRLAAAEADRWESGTRHDLSVALGDLPAAAVLVGLEGLLGSWRQPRLPLPGDVRAAAEGLPAWMETRAALHRLGTVRWVLEREARSSRRRRAGR